MKKKYKRLTAAEKKLNREVKQELIKDGVLPPPKKPLNRKAFAKEVHMALEVGGLSPFRLREALPWMMPPKNPICPVTAEAVGVLKLVRIAVELESFWVAKEAAGKTSATYEELFKAIQPILDL